jgi:hypothetical protein
MKYLISLLLLTGALQGAAHADAIPGEKEGCHDGTVGRSSHVGQFCHPLRCETDADCTGEAVCLPGSQCIVERVQTGGWGTGNVFEDSILAASCPEGSCEEARYCQSTSSDTSTAFICGEKAVAEAAPEVEAAVDGEAAQAEESVRTSTQKVPATATVLEEDDSGCATAVAGMSAGMAGLLGLVALARRRDGPE